MSDRELAVIVCATAASLGDSYCALAWGKKLAGAADASAAAAVLQGVENAGLTARDPNATTPQDVEALRAAGFSEREIFEATAFVAFRVAFSTINDALGVRPDWQLAAAAPVEVNKAVTYGRPVAERH